MIATEDADFALRHRADILAIVDQLHRERTLVTVESSDGHAIVSSVLEVRRDPGALVFDIARDADQNERLFASSILHFVTELDHVRVAFETRAASLVSLTDGPAALVDLPEAVVRLQRREWFRAALPVQPPIRCTVLRAKGPPLPGQAIDLSAGGAALLVPDGALDPSRPGTHHELVLSLPDVGPVELEATLRTVTSSPGWQDGRPKVRLGFRFEDVPAKTANRIQRYVQRIEVEQLRILRRRD